MFFTDFIKLMWQHSKAQTVTFFGLSAVSSLTEGLGLFLLVPILATLQSGGADDGVSSQILNLMETFGLPVSATALITLFLSLVLLRSVVQYVHSVVSAQMQFDLLNALRTRCFDAIISANWRWVSTLTKSDQSNIMTNEMQRISGGLMTAFTLPTTVFLIAAYMVAAISLSFGLALLAFAVGGVLSFLMRGQHTQAFALGRSLTSVQRAMQRTIQEGLAGIKLTKILGNETRHNQKLTGILGSVRDQQVSFVKTNARAGAIFQFIVAVFLGAVVLLGRSVFDVSFASLMVLVVVLVRLAPMLRNLQQAINRLMHTWPALQAFQDLEQQAKANADQYQALDGAELIDLQKGIELADLGFTYSTRDAASLKGTTTTIPANKTTAIVGHSGAGKSTLSDILMGLLEPTSGEIRVDGQVISGDRAVLWRRSVAYVPQDIFLFNDTIENNLLWANPNATPEDMRTALAQAAAGFVFDLPDGTNTRVGDSGHMLSGGERQRIALARALLQDPKLLILDEATSALDVENELRIRQSIESLSGSRTVIVIGHRLPTLETADRVIVLKDGAIAAEGPWADVMEHVTAR